MLSQTGNANVSPTQGNKPQRFSEFAQPAGLDGTKVRLDEILNKEILILNYKVRESKYAYGNSSQCVTVQFTFSDAPNETHIFFTGSCILLEQLELYKEHIPFYTTVKKIDRYYSFT